MGEGRRETEQTLIRESLDGSLEAWGEIVRRYKDAVFGVALGILGSAPDAEDAMQDSFIRAYENLEKFDINRKFSTWIFTVTSNLCKNKLRRERFLAPLRGVASMVSGDDPAEQVERDERAALVREALAELEEKYRAPLVLRFYGELEYQEIAEALNIPAGTVKTRIHRGKRALKDLLSAKGVTAYAPRES